jgi:hypothetical protein
MVKCRRAPQSTNGVANVLEQGVPEVEGPRIHRAILNPRRVAEAAARVGAGFFLGFSGRDAFAEFELEVRIHFFTQIAGDAIAAKCQAYLAHPLAHGNLVFVHLKLLEPGFDPWLRRSAAIAIRPRSIAACLKA